MKLTWTRKPTLSTSASTTPHSRARGVVLDYNEANEVMSVEILFDPARSPAGLDELNEADAAIFRIPA